MNPIAEEIKSYFGVHNDPSMLMHYGKGHLDGGNSGRYPWGSGENPYQRSIDFLARVEKLKAKGWTETPENIKKEFGMNTTQYRREKRISLNEKQVMDITRAKQLKKQGMGPTEIGREMGVPESTVRGWLNQEHVQRVNQAQELANLLKKEVDGKKMVDVGSGVEKDLLGGVSKEKLDTALYILERQGYHVYKGGIPQPTNKNQQTNQVVLAKPEIPYKDIYNYDKVKTINNYTTHDHGDTFEPKFTYPTSLNSKRLQIRYDEDGGTDMDGVIELRRGCQDLYLGDNKKYAQVRILVDNSHYLKGMAVYADDLPDGIDVRFNTNKKKSVPMKEVLKPIKDDPDNPFGSNIKDSDLGGQYWYVDKKDGKKKLGLINKRSDEGDWTEWKDALPSQFLSKQSLALAEKQLNLAKAEKQQEYDDIMSLTNPTVKKYYLKKFADKCDGAAVDLKAAALPGQKYHVILPNNTLKDNEVYAPGYKDGTKLALIRYPHGGTFEIPICTVNNKNKVGEKMIGKQSIDAICINSHVASRLSGADFDGDTVMCIPTHDARGRVKISSRDQLKQLENFEPKLYKYDMKTVDKNGQEHYYRNGKEFKVMKRTDLEMGKISNLITDMTLQGAPDDHLARAVKHSMVVIDAEKHKLDYNQSYKENNITSLKQLYQKKENGKYGGAGTIVSKAKSPVNVEKRQGEPHVNMKNTKWYDPNRPEGALIYQKADDKKLYYADSVYDKKTGIKTVWTSNGKKISYNMNDPKQVDKYEPIMRKDPKTGIVSFTNKDQSIIYRKKTRTEKNIPAMSTVDDANKLVSPQRHKMEILYADYANSMKSLANKARISMKTTENLKYDKNAAKIYEKEVSELNVALNNAMKNSVKERQATRLAAADLKKKKAANPDMKAEDERKAGQRAMTKYRESVGSVSRRNRNISITDKQWEAIQAGAISENKLKLILDNSDPDILRERSMPSNRKGLTAAQISRIKAMANSNFTLQQIADKLGIPKSTVSNALKGAK